MTKEPLFGRYSDATSIPAVEELDLSHPLWEAADFLINDLAPLTRRDNWWETAGPRILIFRALLWASTPSQEKK